MPREKSKGQTPSMRVPEAENRGGAARSRGEVPVMGMDAKGLRYSVLWNCQPGNGRSSWIRQKSFSISKQMVWEAYLRVKANKGAAGVDEISIDRFEEQLKDNLYKLWNRMSSGELYASSCEQYQYPRPTVEKGHSESPR